MGVGGEGIDNNPTFLALTKGGKKGEGEFVCVCENEEGQAFSVKFSREGEGEVKWKVLSKK